MNTTSVWPHCVAASGLLLAVGGSRHPAADLALSYEQATARMLAEPAWIVSHALMLVGWIVLTAGWAGLSRAGLAPARPVRWALAATALLAIEGVVHLAAALEATAARTGGATPITDTHAALSVVAYPAFGVTLAWVAWAVRDVFRPRALFLLGLLGGPVFGVAPVLVVLTRDHAWSVLYNAAVPVSLWLVAVGVRHARRGASPGAAPPAAA